MAISITIVPIDVDLNSDEIGMAFAHLHVPITQNPPFTILDSARQEVTAAFQNCMLASLDSIQGMPSAQIVVFPEFALPFDALSTIEETLRSSVCPSNTLIVTGTEWLNADQYTQMLESSNLPTQLKSQLPDKNLFVNPAIVWVKTTKGELLRYVQPKLRPSPQEAAAQLMYRGQNVLMFVSNKPNVVSLAALICFDCIAVEGEKQMFEQLCEATPETTANSSINWHLLLVPQYNPAPEHKEFLEFAEVFLNRGGSIYNTADSAVAFVNAAWAKHGRAIHGYGRSSIFYRSGRWQEITADGPLDRIPGTYALETITPSLMRARFREDGPSVHRFSFLKAWTARKDAGASRVPLLNARSRKIGANGTLKEWENVPALSKVFIDWLADDLATTDALFAGKTALQNEYADVRSGLLAVAHDTPDRLGQIVDLLLLGFQGPCCRPKINPDAWQRPLPDWREDERGKAIVQLAALCSLVRLLDGVQFIPHSPLCTGTCGHFLFTVVDGWNHCKHDVLVHKYIHWLETHPMGEILGKNLVLILTRTATVYLASANNVAEEITSQIDVTSRRDEAALHAISPDLVTSPDDLTSSKTRVFKHFSAILGQALELDSKQTASQFLRERLGEAI